MKALVGAFNLEKALVGAFSWWLWKPIVEPMEHYTALANTLSTTRHRQQEDPIINQTFVRN